MADLFERMAALKRDRQPFALATVVARRAPVSAHLGDRAIVLADGRMEGFVGGACAREIVRQQALEAMRSRCGRLVSIRPDAHASSDSGPERVVVSMLCASEGAVDVYVEPFLQPRRLIVVGATPVAEALARLARGMDYEVVRVVEAHEQRDVEAAAIPGVTVAALDALEQAVRDGGPDQAAVVASQGHYDDEALEAILRCRLPYVGLVASGTRGAAVRARLEERDARGTADVRIPAGLDLGARTPPEVALSILAEIVKAHPSGAWAPAPPAVAETAPRADAVDPVCGMDVDVATARHTADVEGVVYYFCGPGCRARFLADPKRYLTPAS